MKHKLLTVATLLIYLQFNAGSLFAQTTTAKKELALIPYPQTVVTGNGSFTITAKTTIGTDTSLFANEAEQLNNLLKPSVGKTLIAATKTAAPQTINFTYDAGITSPEAYHLQITPQQITIAAKEPAGAFHAVETIRQLLPASMENNHAVAKPTLPEVNIEDAPTFAWRGMHLDVSRHFFSIAYLKKFIDLMALYKMNKFHIHLTDDQGWRIEIKKYPKLTENGAWRTFNNQDSACMKRSKEDPDFVIDPSHIIHKNGKTLYGGFYTQQQMKALVAYAATKHVDIIPEIDMPGHMMAAINSYPFLTCNGENKFGELFSKPICPCNETTFEFAENVFSEIMDIFPSTYIHIGGDEVDRSDWAKSDACKALMQREGIKDVASLQSYFINRMEKFFNAKGRKLIGWDEIIEGGISPTAIVMYWRSWVPDAPLKAAKNGNTVIMSPGNPLYFDNGPDKSSIYNVYHFNPIPAGLTEQEGKAIIGAQANLWSEMIPTEQRADHMFMPRMTALAEMLWTNKTDKYDSYEQRLLQQYNRMDALKVHYRLPDLQGIVTENVFTDKDTLMVKRPLPYLRVAYTLDGSVPSAASKELKTALIIDKPVTVRLAAITPAGSRGDIYTLNFKKDTYAAPVKLNNIQPGLSCSYYKAFFKSSTLISQAKADSVFNIDDITVPSSVNAPSFALNYSGYINIPADGIYSFYLTCDDGGILSIANKETVNNDGLHSAMEKNGQAALKKGLQPFNLNFVEGGGGFTLRLQYSVKGGEPMDIPSSWFKH